MKQAKRKDEKHLGVSVPDGWKLVPVEPTNEMLDYAHTVWLRDPLRRSTTLYRGMLAAAPQPDSFSDK